MTAENLLNEIRSILSGRGGYEHIERIALVYHFDDRNEEIMTQLE